MDFDRSILFYDGVCHLCHGLVQFVLKYEQNHDLMFSSLQSSFAKSFLPADLSMTLKTVVVYDSKNNQILTKSDAVIFILNQMGGIWRFNAYLLRLFPEFLMNFCYDFISNNRYQWFGRADTCFLLNVHDRILED